MDMYLNVLSNPYKNFSFLLCMFPVPDGFKWSFRLTFASTVKVTHGDEAGEGGSPTPFSGPFCIPFCTPFSARQRYRPSSRLAEARKIRDLKGLMKQRSDQIWKYIKNVLYGCYFSYFWRQQQQQQQQQQKQPAAITIAMACLPSWSSCCSLTRSCAPCVRVPPWAWSSPCRPPSSWWTMSPLARAAPGTIGTKV